jgi:hypothetical protein
VEIPNIQIHNTTTSGLANLPTLSGAASSSAGEVPLHLTAAPAGAVDALPPKMPKLHRKLASVADEMIEIFEVKVVDEDNNRIWHPLYKWDKDARKKYRTDPSGFGQRLNAYYAVRCGEYSSDELSTKTFRALKDMGKKKYAEKYAGCNDKPEYYEACCMLHKAATGIEY